MSFVRRDYFYDVTIPVYKNYVCESIVHHNSNRSGKTLTAAVELARAVTGQDPHGKYPETDGRAILVGKDLEHIGQVMWRKLSRAGAFKVVQRPDGTWAAYDPDDPAHVGLKTKPAPPLIPPRFIKDIAWESKKANIPRKVILKNGWEITFYSSKGQPPQGVDVDLAWFDEEIVHHDWLAEILARLIDREGWFFWSATPQAGTQQLYDLHLRADEAAEEGEESPLVTETFLSIFDNPHLSKQARREFIDSLDDEERRVRVDGEFAITGLKIYESYFFPRGVHGVDAFPIPSNWTRFASIDPGAQVCAILFGACPPLKPDGQADASLYGDFVYLYEEIYIRQCDAAKMAARVRDTVADQEIRVYLIDHHGGRLTEIGSGLTPERQYLNALRKAKVPHFANGGHFVYGSDDLDGGILRVKEYLRVREDGTSRIRVLEGRCRNFVDEMRRYQWKMTDGVVTDKPLKKHDHMPDCFRYLCMYPKLGYHKSKAKPRTPSGPYESFLAVQKGMKSRAKAGKGSGITLG